MYSLEIRFLNEWKSEDSFNCIVCLHFTAFKSLINFCLLLNYTENFRKFSRKNKRNIS